MHIPEVGVLNRDMKDKFHQLSGRCQESEEKQGPENAEQQIIWI